MNHKYIESQISTGECQTIEFKESTGAKVEICETICAFANSEGGNIFVGVKNNGLPSQTLITEKSQTDITDLFTSFKPSLTSLVSVEYVSNYSDYPLLVIIVTKSQGERYSFRNKFLRRVGASNKDVTEEVMRQFTSGSYDWSAQECVGATLDDLEPQSLLNARKIWYKTGNQEILQYSDNQLLKALLDTEKILNATLILFGKQEALSRFGINNEISFEFRRSQKQIEYDDRKDFRNCFLLEYDAIWDKVDARNEVYRFQIGLFIDEIKKFNEVVIREALLNSVAHRDYECSVSSSQVFIKQSPDSIEFQNPGKLPVSDEIQILIDHPSTPKNRKLAEAFQKLKLTNRAGMGVDLITQRTIKEGKGLPRYKNFNNSFVFLTIDANLKDHEFLSYLYNVSKNDQYEFGVHELLALESIRGNGVSYNEEITARLLQMGYIEYSGRGKGSKLILSKKYYSASGDDVSRYIEQKYDKFQHKEKIRRYIIEFGPCSSKDIIDRVKLPVSPRTIMRYLKQLVDDGEVIVTNKEQGVKSKSYIYQQSQ